MVALILGNQNSGCGLRTNLLVWDCQTVFIESYWKVGLAGELSKADWRLTIPRCFPANCKQLSIFPFPEPILIEMPSWQQIQGQLRHPNNPVVFMDVTVGTMVSI